MRRIFGGTQDAKEANAVRRELIMDERVLVISTFELNKVASLTYNELVCDDIFEMIEVIVAQPLKYTALALTKTLVVMQHCLIYGSEKCVNSGYGIARFVEALCQYNTVLLAQQQQGLVGAISRIKGGGVDKGEPVREAAKKICVLLANIKDLQRIRHENASKDSLVPVGSNKVGFITDEVRLLILQKRIEKQNQINLKSNLAKAEGGFGGGYNAADGKSVVGAAHGIEEMMKMAKQQKKKFSDEGASQVGETEDERILRELMEEAMAEKRAQEEALKEAERERKALEAANAKELDLLSFGTGTVTAPAPVSAPAATTRNVFGGGPSTARTPDLLGGGGGEADLLGGIVPFSGPSAPAASQTQSSLLDGFLSFAIGQPINSPPPPKTAPQPAAPAPPIHDPFGDMVFNPAPLASGIDTSVPSISAVDVFSAEPSISVSHDFPTLGMESLTLAEQTTKQQPPATMAPIEDRFAALDALADTSTSHNISHYIAHVGSQNAQSGMIGFALPPTPTHPPSMSISAGAGRIATKYGDAGNVDDDGDNPWVMGGAVGTGLGDPIAPAPGALPPPPPPEGW